MNPRHYGRVPLILLSLLILSLCVGLVVYFRSALAATPQAPKAVASFGTETAFLRENMTAMDRMMAGMNVPATGDIDRDFTRMMIPHHQGAIDMAQALLRHGKNEELRALARGIIAKQEEEIAMMRRIGGEQAPPAAIPAASGSHHHAPH
ncbi:MAG: DUF305 domain-containing protein [Sphingomonas sp.]|jgi:hypothetical protein|uniref:DUF305 domain-containing protein n=1 Tax=Sphingomonas sp. TaxID=28214 RepID=UPI0035651FCF